MIVMGGLGVFVGVISLVVADLTEGDRKDRAVGVGVGGLVLGGLMIAGGITTLANRSKEPRVSSSSGARRTPQSRRKDTFLGDAASAKSREPVTTVPAPFTPLSYVFTF